MILVLKGVSLSVPRGGIVALLGANGAGKTTTLKAISNLLHAERGEVTKGSIKFNGERVDRISPNELVRRGCIQVLEGRHCFEPPDHRGQPADRRLHAQGRATPRSSATSTASTAASPACGDRRQLDRRLYFRRRAADVRDRPRHDVASDDDPARRTIDGSRAPGRGGNLRDRSHPQRQRRASPSCLPSRTPTSRCATRTYGYILETGRVVMDGDAASLRENEDVKEFYLGIAEGTRRSFRDVKSYRRRKRWLS